MKNLELNIKHVAEFVTKSQIDAFDSAAANGLEQLEKGTGAGNDFLGWMHLPSATPESLVADIEKTAATLRNDCEYVVAIGIGGSYLGAKAVIEALSDSFAAYKPASGARVIFAGQNIGEDYTHELISLLKGKKFGIIVISKSGTTTEPAIAFRILKEMLEAQEGKEFASKHIVAVTDAKRGALRSLATEEGYATYVIEDNVGGRFSVLTPVGLLPIAVAGFDIRALLDGAKAMEAATAASDDSNPAYLYAKTRNALYAEGKKTEILVNYNPKLHYLGEWWKQLYGESEGKDNKGIFPAAADFSSDLHSMGQYIQEGQRILFETALLVENPRKNIEIQATEDNIDGLNFLAGKTIDYVNSKAAQGTALAHTDGQVPNLAVIVPALDAYNFGKMVYFFEKACGLSGYLLGVNPFDQPGVEAYKKNMFALLGKPGYESEKDALEARLK